jgi:hypothetical protein
MSLKATSAKYATLPAIALVIGMLGMSFNEGILYCCASITGVLISRLRLLSKMDFSDGVMITLAVSVQMLANDDMSRSLIPVSLSVPSASTLARDKTVPNVVAVAFPSATLMFTTSLPAKLPTDGKRLIAVIKALNR